MQVNSRPNNRTTDKENMLSHLCCSSSCCLRLAFAAFLLLLRLCFCLWPVQQSQCKWGTLQHNKHMIEAVDGNMLCHLCCSSSCCLLLDFAAFLLPSWFRFCLWPVQQSQCKWGKLQHSKHIIEAVGGNRQCFLTSVGPFVACSWLLQLRLLQLRLLLLRLLLLRLFVCLLPGGAQSGGGWSD